MAPCQDLLSVEPGLGFEPGHSRTYEDRQLYSTKLQHLIPSYGFSDIAGC